MAVVDGRHPQQGVPWPPPGIESGKEDTKMHENQNLGDVQGVESEAQAAQPTPELREEYRSMSTDIAALAMPVAVVTAPVVNQWAKQHFSQEGKPQDAKAPDPQPQPEQQKTD